MLGIGFSLQTRFCFRSSFRAEKIILDHSTLSSARYVLSKPRTPCDILENMRANSMVKLESHVVQNTRVISSFILKVVIPTIRIQLLRITLGCDAVKEIVYLNKFVMCLSITYFRAIDPIEKTKLFLFVFGRCFV